MTARGRRWVAATTACTTAWVAASAIIAVAFTTAAFVSFLQAPGDTSIPMMLGGGIWVAGMTLMVASLVSFVPMVLIGLPMAAMLGPRLRVMGPWAWVLGGCCGFTAGMLGALILDDDIAASIGSAAVLFGGSGAVYGIATVFFVTRMAHG